MKEKYRHDRGDTRYKHRRRETSSSSEGNGSSYSPKRAVEMYEALKKALQRRDHKEIYNIIRDLSTLKDDLGILRVTISNTFSFQKGDIQEFFEQFGRIENIIIKEPKISDTQEVKQKDSQNIAYIIFSQHHSAVVALKVLQSVADKEKIVDAKICCSNEESVTEEETFNPMLGEYTDEDFLTSASTNEEIQGISQNYHYVGTIGIDLEEKNFCLKERIMGARGTNFLRVLYICQKAVRLQNEGQTQKNDLILKLIYNKEFGMQRSVLVMAKSLVKYNTAIRYLHQLFEQIVEQYKNSREKSFMIIPKDVHIRRWQKFRVEPSLKFLQATRLTGDYKWYQ